MRKMILLNVWACAIAGTAFAQDFYFTEADNGKGGLTISATDGVSPAILQTSAQKPWRMRFSTISSLTSI